MLFLSFCFHPIFYYRSSWGYCYQFEENKYNRFTVIYHFRIGANLNDS